jgi:hypothetical protein
MGFASAYPQPAQRRSSSGSLYQRRMILPALALENRELLWLERALVLFYGFLLLFVPVVRALQGELPIELSTRGARYAEASDAAVEELKVRLSETERILDETVDVVERVSELD